MHRHHVCQDRNISWVNSTLLGLDGGAGQGLDGGAAAGQGLDGGAAAGQVPDGEGDAGQGLQREGQRGAGDTSLSRVPRQKHQQCQYSSSTLSLLSLSPRVLTGRVLTAMLGRACRRRVNEEQVIRHHHVCQDRNINSVNIRAVLCHCCTCS